MTLPDPDITEFEKDLVEEIEEVVKPISRPDHIPEEKVPLDLFGILTRIVLVACLVGAIIAFGTSVYAFAGFAENDTGFLHLLSAFLLCFGIGATAYIPGFYIARKAYDTIRNLPSKTTAFLIISLTMPWLILSFFMFRLGGYWSSSSLLAILISLLVLAWCFLILQRQPKPETPELQTKSSDEIEKIES